MIELLKKLTKAILYSASFTLGVSVNLLIFALNLQFLSVPSGASIRPMTWAALTIGIALGAFVLGLGAFLWNVVRGRNILGLIGLYLCMMPLPLSSQLLNVLAQVRGFYVGD